MLRCAKSPLWRDWLDRDDRKWVEDLARGARKSGSFDQGLRSYIESIVTAGKIASHPSSRPRTSKECESQPVEAFCEHLRSSSFFGNVQKSWRRRAEGPWSLPLELAVEHRRWQTRAGEPPRENDDSQSEPWEGLVEALIESADRSLGRVADADARLALRLHFEGLVVDEIAVLTGVATPTLNALIALSKAFVREDLRERWGA